MKSKIMILIVCLWSCAPLPTQELPTSTSTLAPTVTPAPSATATVIPTEKSTPTEVPIPANEYQVKDADGTTLIVVNDQLYKWENGQQILVEIENVVFENAIDASNATKAIAPEAYFDVEGGQQALKDILLPEGVIVHWKTRATMEMVGSNTIGIYNLYLYGVPVAVERVKADPNDNYDLVILSVAIVGSDQPVPAIVGKYENGKFYQLNSRATIDYSADDSTIQVVRDNVEPMDDVNAVKALIGKAVKLDATIGFQPSEYKQIHNDRNLAGNDFLERLLNRLFDLRSQTAVNEGIVDDLFEMKFSTTGEMMNWFIKDWFNRGLDFDGFISSGIPRELIKK